MKAATSKFIGRIFCDNAGAPVVFVPVGFHTLDIPAKGGSPAALFVPGDPLSGVNDAAGNPFWFNGQPSLGFNPALFNFTFGKTLTYTGKTAVESGLPVQNNPKPVTVKFAKPGTYTYYCDVHAGMKATVHVVARKAKAPSVKTDAKAIAAQANRGLKALKALLRTKPGSGSIQIGASAPHGVESYSFYPAKTTVKPKMNGALAAITCRAVPRSLRRPPSIPDSAER